MSSDEDNQNQQHKSHKMANPKLKKKRKQEKEQHKIKKLQKKAYELIKDEKRYSFFAQKNKKKSHSVKDENGIKVKKFDKALKSFLKVYEDEIEQFFDIFEQLDQGAEIETSDIEDIKIKEKLEKLFQILQIKDIGDSLCPKYKKQGGVKSLKQYVKNRVNNILDITSKSEESLSRAYSHSHSQSHSHSHSKSESVDKSLVGQQIKKPIHKVEPVKKYGPQFIPPEFDRKDIEQKLQAPVDQSKKKENSEMDVFLDGVFGKSKTGQLNQFLESRVKQPKPQPEKPLQNDDIEYLGGKKKDEEMSQDQLKRYMQTWDQENRGKSLMQLHQERLRQEKSEKFQAGGKAAIRKDFNKDTDLGYFKQDSKKVMGEMRQGGGGSLSSKFQSADIQNSFI